MYAAASLLTAPSPAAQQTVLADLVRVDGHVANSARVFQFVSARMPACRLLPFPAVAAPAPAAFVGPQESLAHLAVSIVSARLLAVAFPFRPCVWKHPLAFVSTH